MLCCLNSACHNQPNPDGTMFCSNCGTRLVVLRNRYCPVKSLGAGGFGKTYLAEDIDKLNEPCVIKQFAPQIQGTASLNKATELFEQEAKRLQQLGKHPQIPTLLAYFEEDNRLYLVQEFIDGQNLLAELQQQGIFNEQKVRELLLDLLEILKTVHQQKVIHRDIKPENIIRRSDGKLVLIDFGASKQLTMTVMTQPGTAIGSFGYAPLEQMEGGKAYRASDLYSVGATCFHLLTGIHPWELWKRQGYGWGANWRQHLQQPVSQDLGRILDKLLQEKYQQRYYQSAAEVLQDLNLPPSPVLPTQPVIAAASPAVRAISPLKQALANAPLITKLMLLYAVAVNVFILIGLFWIPLFSGITDSPKTIATITPIKTLQGHSDKINSVAISPDGKTLASGSDDKTIKLWNLTTGEQIRTLPRQSFSVSSVAISRDGRTLTSVSNKTIKLWNLATGEQIRTRTLPTESFSVSPVAISPDGKTLALVSDYNLDGTSASYSLYEPIKLWNLATGEKIRTLIGHSDRVDFVAISPDGKTLVSSSQDDTIKLWNLPTGQQIRTLTGDFPLFYVAFSADGKTLASVSVGGNTIKLWNLATGEQIRTLTELSSMVSSVAFSPDGKTLASLTFGDETIKLWNLATGEEIHRFTGHSDAVNSIAFSPDGKTLVSASDDKNIKIWRLR
ncbi:MAG: serine/threonine-protein kinase [Nostoc sp.]|uniref:serine/threonine-protein kinase n=1 Tax=Nostoc sp. TaxID=1180 RepID=UPI002FFA8D7B